ncbi:response regulator transcription factor [Cohnella terricola]|uniref:Response regulator n=1 Tax=Cohnella terricola TaxID=1289167 RepID=A0A559JT39_9BACL|nr:response regulator [Cohnella terricola]TVY03000.1 response regulator [Cohnella terricola]
MYQVLVVDDEPMICTGVATVLMNAGIGVSEVFVANNGFEALDYIRMDKIDLIITDIQMEQMSGIELIETVFAENPMIPMIVLSAHGEFEYAQKALRFGVKEYIVKPVVPSELLRVVQSLLTDRDAQLRSVADAAPDRVFVLEDMVSKRSHILNEIATEGVAEDELDELFECLGCRLEGPFFCALTVKLDLAKAGLHETDIRTFRDRNLLRYAALNIVEETLNRWNRVVFYSGSRSISIVLQYEEREIDSKTLLNEQTMIAQLIHHNLFKYIHLRSVIGISRVREGMMSWVELFAEAGEAIRWSEIHKDHPIFYIGDFGRHESPPSSGDVPVPSRILEDNNSFIQSAVQYIESNYKQKGLKLQEIAEYTYLSPNYLSYLFKKTVGINLWDYVTELRMKEAKRLLLTTDMRRYEIADEIGYESPEHFGKIFKKYFGVNPSEIK